MKVHPDEKVFVTGNTIVDAVFDNLKIAEDSLILEKQDARIKVSRLTRH